MRVSFQIRGRMGIVDPLLYSVSICANLSYPICYFFCLYQRSTFIRSLKLRTNTHRVICLKSIYQDEMLLNQQPNYAVRVPTYQNAHNVCCISHANSQQFFRTTESLLCIAGNALPTYVHTTTLKRLATSRLRKTRRSLDQGVITFPKHQKLENTLRLSAKTTSVALLRWGAGPESDISALVSDQVQRSLVFFWGKEFGEVARDKSAVSSDKTQRTA